MMRKQTGFTLIELVISMVIIGIGVAGILQVMTLTTARSADPMIQHQAVAIAEAYLEEILTKAYDDPDAETGTCEEGAPVASRGIYDDVNDYACITGASADVGARNQFGALIPGLGAYTVTIAVGAPAAIDGILARQINVTVTHAVLDPITITGFRTNY
jgi:MSHA pilin protein MshD